MINQKNLTRFETNEDMLTLMAKQFQKMKETFQEETAILHDHIIVVEQALAERKVLIQQILRSHSTPKESPQSTKFPIDSEEDLGTINNAIDSTNMDAYIKEMQLIMKPKGVHSYLRKIISDRIIMDYNVDGVRGRKPLKVYSNFFKALLKSIPVTKLSGSAESQLRDAIKLQKKRKLLYDERKKSNKTPQVESLEDDSN